MPCSQRLKDEIEDLIRQGYLRKYMPAKDYRIEAATTKKITDESEMAHQKPIDGLVGVMY